MKHDLHQGPAPLVSMIYGHMTSTNASWSPFSLEITEPVLLLDEIPLCMLRSTLIMN
jgi:hypothetical protein